MTKILIVDDSSFARRSTRLILEELGHTVEEASDGAQALERYFLNRHELVVLDMVMTGMYGTEVLTKLREVNPDIKVIVATADIQKSTIEEVRTAGASAFVNKPVNKKQLADAVAVVLGGGNTWS
ncbi:response regulator [Oleiharenicola lentus]|uniref:response regulator n=1 Tax=Oleiharenicola lentus TaxID=2508720 RepID=UPI003F664754